MSHRLKSPVQTQIPSLVVKGSCHGESYWNNTAKPAGRRRVFVQTETGFVFGMELDRDDNAHTLKKRVQLALNVPTEECFLTFGDFTINSDLNCIRNDSAVLLTRNGMQRSSSSPCLSPTWRSSQQRDHSSPVEILGGASHFAKTNELVKYVLEGIKNGIDPIPVCSGLGGAYCFRNSKGESVAIVKPTDEEPFAPNNPNDFVGRKLGQPGLKPTVRVGESGFREVAAYLLDHDHFANVPLTALVKVTHSIFNVNDSVCGSKLLKRNKVSKIASLQQFIPHDFDASDHGASGFLVGSIHRIGILDIRIFNTDRHAGNLLVRQLDGCGGFGQVELTPIDHGLCLPESLEDPYFEWIHWPQASVPFSENELAYIRNLDPFRDSEMLRTELPMIREACLRVLVLCTIFLQEGAAFGLCLSEIGEMMSREFRSQEEEPSELEGVCLEAKRIIKESVITLWEADNGNEEFQFGIEDLEVNLPTETPVNFLKKPSFHHVSKATNEKCFLPKVGEIFEDNEEPSREEKVTLCSKEDWFQTASRLSLSLKKINMSERSHDYHRRKTGSRYMMGGSLSVNRSANEQLPSSTSFVKLADMNEKEWTLFLEQFKELLTPAFTKRRSATNRQNQRLRLGTSCQF